ncbi:DUF4145 domain-containing protein [Rhizobium nepotum]|uniref:DUF4145 domain-containing protein n=1 Tax=Rhizobium nepotum TaxID=1035271 RepID=UPI003CEA483F
MFPRQLSIRKRNASLCHSLQRIDKLEAKKSGHKDALDALRWIGNHASHSGMTSTEVLLAGFELFEGVVAELIDKKSAAKAAMAKLLIKSRGKTKSP